jgi:hypothetical protein
MQTITSSLELASKQLLNGTELRDYRFLDPLTHFPNTDVR